MPSLLKLFIIAILLLYSYNSFSTNYYVKQEYIIPHDSISVCDQFACEYDVIHFWVEENYGGASDFTYRGIKRTDTTYSWEVAGIMFGNDTLRYLFPNKAELFINIGESKSDCFLGGVFGGAAIFAPVNDNQLGNASVFLVLQCEPIAQYSLNSINTICQNTCVTFTDSSLYRPRHWLWEIVNSSSEIVYTDTLQNIEYCFADTGTYLIHQKVWNAKGIDSTSKQIRVISSPFFTNDITQTIRLQNTTQTELTACAEGENYEWFPNQNLSCTNCSTTTATVNSDIRYYCIVSNTNGCADTCFYNIELPFDIFIPNAFSPNGDGVNDVFKVRGNNIKVENCKIYNRFGIEIYNGNLENGWNGTFKNEVVESGVYGYQILYLNKKTKITQNVNGNLTIIR